MLSAQKIVISLLFVICSYLLPGQWIRPPHTNGDAFPNLGMRSVDLKLRDGKLFELSKSWHGGPAYSHSRDHINIYDTNSSYIGHLDLPQLGISGRNYVSHSYFLGDSLVLISTSYDHQYTDSSSIELFSLSGSSIWRVIDTNLLIERLVGWNDTGFFYKGHEGLVYRNFLTGQIIHKITSSKFKDSLNGLIGIPYSNYSLVANHGAYPIVGGVPIISLISNDSTKWYTEMIVLNCDENLDIQAQKSIPYGTSWSFYREESKLHICPDSVVLKNGFWNRIIFTYDPFGSPKDTIFYPITDAQTENQALDNTLPYFIQSINDSLCVIIHRSAKTPNRPDQYLRMQYLNPLQDRTTESIDFDFQPGSMVASHSLEAAFLDSLNLDLYLSIRFQQGAYRIAKVGKGQRLSDNQFVLDTLSLSSASVFPNPTKDFINIHASTHKPIKEVQILDVYGKSVFTQASPLSKTQISLIHLKKGIYLINMMYLDGSKELYKVWRN